MFWSSKAWAQSMMPVAATQIASKVTELYTFIVVASVIACILLIGAMIYFVIKYKRRTASDKTAYITHNNILEFLWSFIPFVIFMFVFGWGWKIYHDMRKFPKDALEVHVVGKQWSWDFIYKSGRVVSREMVVPVNAPIKLIMTSSDVIHSFFVPSFRIKQDVVPGKYTALWFNADKIGDYNVFCTEYCGKDHSAMLAKIKVVSRADYEQWLANDPNKGMSLADLGAKLYRDKACIGCHSLDGTPRVGPTFKGLWGARRTFADGSSLDADENYITESIMTPQKRMVQGFEKQMMPSFQGSLNDREVAAIIEFIKGQK